MTSRWPSCSGSPPTPTRSAYAGHSVPFVGPSGSLIDYGTLTTDRVVYKQKAPVYVLARTDALDLPAYTGFVQPELEAVRDVNGHIVDVTIAYPCDLTAQMLRYADRYATLPPT